MKLSIFNIDINIKYRIFKRNWLFNFIPMIGRACIGSDKEPHFLLGTHYDFSFCGILIYLFIKNKNMTFRKTFTFPNDNVVEFIYKIHKNEI